MCDVRLASIADTWLLRWLAVGVIAFSACGGDSTSPVPATTPPHRETQLTMSGAIAGPFQLSEQRGDPIICAGSLFGDPHGINYVLSGQVPGVTDGDYSLIGLSFSVHRFGKPGTFSVGTFPDGTTGAPAVASIARELTPQNIVSWISGSGSVVVDAGTRSGTLDLHLNSVNGLDPLNVAGTWSCPVDS